MVPNRANVGAGDPGGTCSNRRDGDTPHVYIPRVIASGPECENVCVDKLRFDLRNPDSEILRQAVFARLRAGWVQVENADYDGRRRTEGFDAGCEVRRTDTTDPGWQAFASSR